MECDLVQPFWRAIWQFLVKWKMSSCLHSAETISWMCTRIFMAVIYVIGKIKKCPSAMDIVVVTQRTIYSTDSITALFINVDFSQKHKVDQERKMQMDIYSMIPLIWCLNKCKIIQYIDNYIYQASGQAEQRFGSQFTSLQRIYTIDILLI